jgi:hypothetical protein
LGVRFFSVTDTSETLGLFSVLTERIPLLRENVTMRKIFIKPALGKHIRLRFLRDDLIYNDNALLLFLQIRIL